MKRLASVIALFAMLLCACGLSAADRNLADGLAAAGAAQNAKGNIEKAKDTLYKALAYDTTSPDAIFELAKVFEKEGNTVEAGDFYQRAAVIYSQEGKPAGDPKRSEADRKVKALNPFATRLIAVYDDYAQELAKVVKAKTDSLTHDCAVDRIKDLNLPSVLPADKIPLFYKDALAVASQPKPKAPDSSSGSTSSSSKSGRKFDSATGEYTTSRVDNVPPDVARELKAAGWETVKGTWVKKAPNVYEVTNGRLETKKVVGAIDLLVWKGFTGTVAALARDDSSSTSFSSTMSSSSRIYAGNNAGYGIVLHKDVTIFAPMLWSGMGFTNGDKYESYRYNYAGTPLPDVPKQHLYVLAGETNMEMVLNEKKQLAKNDKNLPQRGQFVIEVDGKATLEMPRAIGR